MTGLADGQVVFEITGDNKGIKQALTDTTNTIKTESKKWDTEVENSSANMTSAFDKALDIKRKEAESQKKTFQYDASTRMSMVNSLTLSAEETKAR